MVVAAIATAAEPGGEVEEDGDGDGDVDEMESGEGVVEGEKGVIAKAMALPILPGIFDALDDQEGEARANRRHDPAQGPAVITPAQFGEAAGHEPTPGEEDRGIEKGEGLVEEGRGLAQSLPGRRRAGKKDPDSARNVINSTKTMIQTSTPPGGSKRAHESAGAEPFVAEGGTGRHG